MILLISPATAETWQEWRARFPKNIGCVNGHFSWKQTSSAETLAHDRSRASVALTLTLPDGSVIREVGIAENSGVTAWVKGKTITAGIGTQLLSLRWKDQVLCESWKFEEPTEGFYNDYSPN